VLLALLVPAVAAAQAQTLELIGQIGSRSVLLVLHATQRDDGGSHLTGEYVVLPTLARRFLEGERGPELGATSLREGTSAIFFGRPPTGELRGTLREGSFRGVRLGPGGQERERFDFSDEFPPMDGWSAAVRCEATEGRYASQLELAVDAGRLKSLDWRSRVAPSGHACRVNGLEQQPERGGLRFAAAGCAVTLRDLGEFVKVAAAGCSAQCASEAWLEPLLVDRRGRCRLLRPEVRQP